MKVGELIAELRKLDPEALVILSEDEEGNGFSPLVELSGPGWWEKQDREYFDDEDEDGVGAEDYGVRAVCLWP